MSELRPTSRNDGACENTDREIYRERPDDYYADSIHVTEGGSIGINCGGMVYVKPIREWHRLAAASESRPTIYSAAEPLEGGKVLLHLAPPPIWDGEIRFDSDCILNGVLVQAGTNWNVLLRREKK